MQSKQEQIAKSRRQNALLADLNALDDARKSDTPTDKVDVLAEASPALPLWRRVDRQYWWNEWISKPFIDAGVRYTIQGVIRILTYSRSSTHMFSQLCKDFTKLPPLRSRKI